MKNLKRVLGICLLAAAAIMGGLLTFAPQVPILLREGFPPEVWAGSGRYLTVEGVNDEDEIDGPKIPAAAQTRFDDAGGRAMLVEQNGTLIFESYGQGFGPQDRLNSFSMVKSLVGALVIRALADKRITSLDDPLALYLGPEAPDVTINDALTMTSGLLYDGEPPKSVDDAGFSPFGPLARLHVFGIDAVLPELTVNPTAQGQFAYQSVNTALLGAVLEAAYDQPLPQILSDLIWKPAGAANADWRAYSKAEGVSAYCCLYARPEDWLRVGRYLLENGTPNEPFLPDDLWRDFIIPELAVSLRHESTYGWHLRHDVLDRDGETLAGPFAYFMGHGGQMLYLLPENNMVVVRFGERPQLLHSTLYELSPPK
ncbi:serine hydrolase domain-containing protein [Parasulfitobacter algicola]|uniref:Serine hydrolase n=1 Tax=Parasulfitobacter algicola TaxID=2614809 RepID=A0ABX2J061_9RHOB|nr:serine hydrolase [Sulfitobacter algicola]NSX56413.1 serine hydrolase [Sulfitobacter algicola]